MSPLIMPREGRQAPSRPEPGNVVSRAVAGFVGGALAVLGPHQSILWLLHEADLTLWPGYSTKPTAPFGVPAFWSAAFWGGVWGILIIAILTRRAYGHNGDHGARYWLEAAGAGAVLPTAVGALLTATGHGVPLGSEAPEVALATAVAVNLVWGLFAVGIANLLLSRFAPAAEPELVVAPNPGARTRGGLDAMGGAEREGDAR